jgi:hypothetical protein
MTELNRLPTDLAVRHQHFCSDGCGHIPKPFTIAALTQKLTEILQK